jgi:hypothetical protein
MIQTHGSGTSSQHGHAGEAAGRGFPRPGAKLATLPKMATSGEEIPGFGATLRWGRRRVREGGSIRR